MSSSDPNPNPGNPTTSGGAAPATKSSKRSLIILAGLAVVAAVAAFAVPEILVQIYHAEEEAKARGGNVVGSLMDAQLPADRSRDPYARPGAGSAAPDESTPADEKPADEKPAEDTPPEDNKPAEDEPTDGADGEDTEPKSPE